MEKGSQGKLHEPATRGLRIRVLNTVLIVLVALFTALFLFTAQQMKAEYDVVQRANDAYTSSELAASDLMNVSTYLTTQSRLFTAAHNVSYLNSYFAETTTANQREENLQVVQEHYPGSRAVEDLQLALSFSKALQDRELYSMKLVVYALDMNVGDEIAAQLDAVPFKRDDGTLTKEELLEKAHMLVTNEAYEHEVNMVTTRVDLCKEELTGLYRDALNQHADRLETLLAWQQAMAWALAIVVAGAIAIIIVTMLLPIRQYIAHISNNERLPETGAHELRFLAQAYNVIYEENRIAHTKLVHEAEHDSLTGLFNRGAFEKLLSDACAGHCALVLVDVDHFKDANDQFGHDVGDQVLKRVAALLASTFRTTDCPCRIGGDEFAVILNDFEKEQRAVIETKLASIAAELARAEEGLPACHLSIGVAFGTGEQDGEALYKFADEALYRVKNAGRNGVAFHED